MSFLKAMALTAANYSNMLSATNKKLETSSGLATNLPSKSNEGELSIGPPDDRERAPPFMKAISELQSLSNVMKTFNNRWDELQKHLDYIENAIERREEQLVTLLPSDQPKDSGTCIDANVNETASLTAKETTESHMPSPQNQESERKDPTSLRSGNSSESYIESLCRDMSSRELRRYIVTHLSEASKLRQEVPVALKSAPNPAKLVLECVGKFFLQGSKAFTKNSAMIPSRKAALLILEYFLLMDCNNGIDQSVKQEAEQAALAWRKRLIVEGGMFKACDEDARGLLLLVACFGIPDEFSIEDLIHLLRLSNACHISEALRKPSFLVARIPDIIEYMRNKEMHIEAVDTVYTFGIEDKFSQKVLTPFLTNLKDSWKKARREAKGSPFLLKEAVRKKLTALKSLMKCLKAHKINLGKVLPGWKLHEKIINLEKDINDLDRKIASKRKAEEESFRVSNAQDFKRPKVIGEALLPIPSPFSSLQEPMATTNQLVYHLGSSRYSDPVNTRSAASSSWPHEYDPIGVLTRVGLPGSSFGATISSGPGLTPIANERSVERNFVGSTELGTRAYVGSTELGTRAYVGSTELGTLAYVGSTELGTRAYVGSSESGTRAYVGSSSLVEGFRGVSETPAYGAASRSSASDLYNFADAVLDRDYGRRPGDMPASTSYRSPFL